MEDDRLDRTLLGWVATGIVLPRLCGTCYEASERAREMEEKMTTETTRQTRTGKCECQWDEHFTDRPVPGTVRHTYKARAPKLDLQPAGTSSNGHVFLKCGPCRRHHNTAELQAALLRRITYLARLDAGDRWGAFTPPMRHPVRPIYPRTSAAFARAFFEANP